MIENDKLKIAEELAYKRLNNGQYTKISIEYLGNRKVIGFTLITSLDGEPDWYFDSIDGLLKKLTELTELTELTNTDKPKPKYEVGQKVWYFYEDEIRHDIVEGIEYHEDCFIYTLVFGFFSEESLFPSREALIEYQIKYWNNLRMELMDHSTFASITEEQ